MTAVAEPVRAWNNGTPVHSRSPAAQRRLRNLALVIATTVALVVHVAAFTRAAPDPNAADGPSYLERAQNLADGRGFVAAVPIAASVQHAAHRPTAPDTLRTPGYPVLIAAAIVLGIPLAAVIALQHLLVVGMTVLVFVVAERVTGRWQGAFAASMLLAVFPPLISTAQQYMSDVVAAAVILAAMLAAWRAAEGMTGWAVVGGVLAGAATLIRPIALFWFVPLAIVVAIRSRRTAIVLVLAALVLPAAWIMRNERVTGVATISSIGGENLLFFRAAGAMVVANAPPGFGFIALQRQSGFYRNSDTWKIRLADQALDELRHDGVDPFQLPHALLARKYSELAIRVLLRHIPETLELTCSALIEIFIGPFFYHFGPGGIGIGLLVLVLVCRGLWHVERTFGLLLAVTIAYFALMAAGPEAEVRFAIAFAPAYAIAFGVGLTSPHASRDGMSGPS
jgi:4-amino-4-deoxy-L-arabinose transferase-like glycosyltransferase